MVKYFGDLTFVEGFENLFWRLPSSYSLSNNFPSFMSILFFSKIFMIIWESHYIWTSIVYCIYTALLFIVCCYLGNNQCFEMSFHIIITSGWWCTTKQCIKGANNIFVSLYVFRLYNWQLANYVNFT